jgi:two-component system OmpR family response regulator
MENRPILLTSVSAQPRGHILVVEDDPVIHRMLSEVLGENGFSVTGAGSAVEMDRVLASSEIDLMVLDVMLPGEDGFSICSRLRSTSNVPILMLTALGQDIDRIVGLEIGADDYVTKPFNSREVVARIRALLRRARAFGTASGKRAGPLRFAGWRIYPAERRLLSPEGVRVTTTSAEFDILLAFCQHSGEVLSREQLLELTHGGAAGPVERSVDVHVSRIRQKIEPDPGDPSLIKTVRLGGYIFTAEVEAI